MRLHVGRFRLDRDLVVSGSTWLPFLLLDFIDRAWDCTNTSRSIVVLDSASASMTLRKWW